MVVEQLHEHEKQMWEEGGPLEVEPVAKKHWGQPRKDVKVQQEIKKGVDVGSLVASDEDEGSSMRWSDTETMKLLEWLLGAEHTDWYEAFVKSPSH